MASSFAILQFCVTSACAGNTDAQVISNQHKDYLIKQLQDFRSGPRRNEES
jgi:cytochrome c553